MARRIQLVVFDFDGTLVDSQHMIARCMSESFTAHGLAPPGAEAVRRVVGLNLERAMAELLPDPGDVATAVRLAEGYRQVFFALRAQPDYLEPMFDGARETLQGLDEAGYVLGIATGKSRRGLVASLERHGLSGYFATLQTSDTGPGKPHPDMLRRAMAEVGVAPQETALVGDTTFDMEMAASAGTTGIGVAWGYHEREELRRSGAVAILEAFDELTATLAGLGSAAA